MAHSKDEKMKRMERYLTMILIASARIDHPRISTSQGKGSFSSHSSMPISKSNDSAFVKSSKRSKTTCFAAAPFIGLVVGDDWIAARTINRRKETTISRWS